jgi:tetraacyldisaccharide 4'-kinase
MSVLELLYLAGHSLKTLADGVRRRTLPVPVVSIGNITTGGTGKTPATVALAREALRRGLRPAILTRGYRGRLKGPVLIAPDMNARDAGDEPLMMARALPGVPVIKDAVRYRGGEFALRTLRTRPDLFILDDGFQHRRLGRDLDIVLVSAQVALRLERLLPAGNLREPLKSLLRADVIVVTKCDDVSFGETVECVRLYNHGSPIFAASHEPSALVRAHGGEPLALGAVRGERVFVLSGIAHPASFLKTVQSLGGHVVGERRFRDHHVFSDREVAAAVAEGRAEGARWILTTEKDIMRLAASGTALPENLLAVSIVFQADEAYYKTVFSALGQGEADADAR